MSLSWCSWICCRSKRSWRAGFSGRGSLGRMMNPRWTRRSQISWWKVKVIRAARNAIVALTNADVKSSARSAISVFIGMLVVVG